MTGETDLAARWLGGSVMAASDESFGDKENLLNVGPAAFEAGHYGNRGEIVDGWETRRRREPGHDWALVRLGVPGAITSVDVDTSFFTGNYPEFCRIEACGREGYPGPGELTGPGTEWVEVVPRSPLQGDGHNTFPVSESRRFTHVRLSVFPDGGVARLRIFGQAVPDPRLFDDVTADLANQLYGGQVVGSSDAFYTSALMLNRPDEARTMGEGWETRRRRDAGHDYVILRLGIAGHIRQLIIDTRHFKYNASAEVAVYGFDRPTAPPADAAEWTPLLERTRLQPDTRHQFATSSRRRTAVIRIDAFPDGGLSRVRVIGKADPAARRTAGYAWFNSLPDQQAIEALEAAGIDSDMAMRVIRQRPLPQSWIDDHQSSPSLSALLEGHRADASR
jgi:allantoicase